MVDSEYVFWGSILRDHRSADTTLAATQLVEELFELGRVGIQLVENAFFAMLGLVLRLPSAKSFRQVMPVFEKPRVQHLQNSADVAGALAIEIKSSGGRVGVFRAGAVSRAPKTSSPQANPENPRCREDAQRVLGPFARRLAGVDRVS